MSERLSIQRSFGMNRNTLRLWGLIIAAAGVLGRGILQNRVLGIGTSTSGELLELMQASNAAMNAATAALVLQAIEGMAVPIFVLLTVDGFQRTSSVRKYLLRMAGVALLSELPYNLAINGTLLAPATRNPVFGLVLVLAMLYLFRNFAGTDFSKLLIKAVVFAAAWIWAAMLSVEHGRSMVVIAAVLWMLRGRHTMSLMMAGAAALCCCIGDPLFMFAPFGLLIAHFYNGEEGLSPKALRYALYPVILLLVAAVGYLLF